MTHRNEIRTELLCRRPGGKHYGQGVVVVQVKGRHTQRGEPPYITMDKYINWAERRDCDTSATWPSRYVSHRDTNSTFLRVVTPYIAVEVYRRFGDTYRFYGKHQKVSQERNKLLHGVTARKPVIVCGLFVACLTMVNQLRFRVQWDERETRERGSRRVFKDNHSAVCIIRRNSLEYTVACRTARWADIPGPFLGNGSLNTFPLLGSRFFIME
jgi:hypothetical protein